MTRSASAGAIVAAVVLALVSCSDVGDGWLVLEGNYAFQRGEFQKASLSYLLVRPDSRGQPWVQYNLGNVYNALGEANTALAAWNSVTDQNPDELRFRLAFNKGCLLYQKGMYKEAYDSFQSALLLRSSSLDAKRNLELSLLKIQNFPAATRSTKVENLPPVSQESRALLDYINRLEGTRWKNLPSQKGSISSSQDY